MFRLATFLTEVPDAFNPEETMKEIINNPGTIKTYIKDITPTVISYCIQIVICLIVLFIGIKIIKGICKIVKKSMERHGADYGITNFINSLLKYLLEFLLIMFLLSTFGMSGTIVAILGSAGLTIGLALQGSLANFAGGVLIILMKPFSVGDYIVDHGNGQEGTVSDINIFYTKILTIDNKVIFIPNGQLSNATVTNVNKMDERRVDLIFSVDYGSDLSKAKEVLRETALCEKHVLTDMDITVYVDSLKDSSVELGLRVWVKSSDYFTVKWDLTEHVKIALDEAGVMIPFPQVDVHMK